MKFTLLIVTSLLSMALLQTPAQALAANIQPAASADTHAHSTKQQAADSDHAGHLHAADDHAAEDKQQNVPQHQDNPHHEDDFIRLDAAAAAQAGVQTAQLSAGVVRQTAPLFGVIAALPQQFYRIEAPFDGVISQLLVQAGSQVRAGQVLLTGINSANLQPFSVKAPAAGEVLQVLVNQGERTGGRVLLELADLSRVQLELSVFPSVLSRLQLGTPVQVQDLHGDQRSDSSISYIAPVLTAGHIARARAELVNPQQNSSEHNNTPRWRPGMHVKAEVTLNSEQVALRVENSALQQLNGQTVLFVEVTPPRNNATAANTSRQFKAVPVRVTLQDQQYSAVSSLSEGSLESGMPYVVQQSFLLKADLGKAAASHQH